MKALRDTIQENFFQNVGTEPDKWSRIQAAVRPKSVAYMGNPESLYNITFGVNKRILNDRYPDIPGVNINALSRNDHEIVLKYILNQSFYYFEKPNARAVANLLNSSGISWDNWKPASSKYIEERWADVAIQAQDANGNIHLLYLKY